MTFVANPLKQFHRWMIQAQPQRFAFARPVNFLKLLRQPDDWDTFETQRFKLLARGVQLAFAAVDQDKIWKRGWRMEDGGWLFPAFAILCPRYSILVFDGNSAPHFPAGFVYQLLQLLRNGFTTLV